MAADLFDKPFPRSCLGEDTKSGSSESTKRKEPTKDVAAALGESGSLKESVDGTTFWIRMLLIGLHWA